MLNVSCHFLVLGITLGLRIGQRKIRNIRNTLTNDMKHLRGRGCKRDGVAAIQVEHAGTRCGTWSSQAEDKKRKLREGRYRCGAVFAGTPKDVKLSVLLLYHRVQIGLGCLLLQCTLALFISTSPSTCMRTPPASP